MYKHRKTAFLAFIASEGIHIFCCVLPTLFSGLSLMVGIGYLSAMPAFIVTSHELIHSYEIPVMATSFMIIVLGWGFYIYARRLDCLQETTSSCCHEPCAPKKDRSRLFLILASLMFIINLMVYFIFHFHE